MSSNPEKSYRVLFVEDAFDQALLVKTFLSGAEGGEFAVTHSQDGDSAVQLIKDEEWDLVITDLNLPGTDGFQVIQVARKKNAELPILATTGYTGPEYEEQALRAGANEVLIKPLQRDDFLGTVMSLVTRSAATKPGVAGTVLAVGGLPGDVEMGCGGTLMKAAVAGRRVVVVPLGKDDLDTDGKALKASKVACALMGFKLVVDKPSLGDTQRRMAVMEKAIADLEPTHLYLPAMDDAHPARKEAFRVAQALAGPVKTVLGYQTATTGTGFKPVHFVDVSDQMEKKTEALAKFGEGGAGRQDLTPDMAEAYARYWGRMHEYADAEAFEIIKGKA